MGIRRYTAHLKRELRHKWYVFMACRDLGIPWLGLIHDWSKFTPREFFPYARNYYTEDGKQLEARTVRTVEYAYAVLMHFNRNKHHQEYWIFKGEPLPMPSPYREEMLADWLGYSGTNGVPASDFYIRLKEEGEMYLHPDTQSWVEKALGIGPGERSVQWQR